MYFAHPMSFYGMLIEKVIISVLEQEGYEVLNPGAVEYQREYAGQRFLRPQDDPMEYWIRLARTCECCAFTTFPACIAGEEKPAPKPRVGAGVIKEVHDFRLEGKPVWWISPDFNRVEDIVLVPFKSWRGFQRLTVAETEFLLHVQTVHATK